MNVKYFHFSFVIKLTLCLIAAATIPLKNIPSPCWMKLHARTLCPANMSFPFSRAFTSAVARLSTAILCIKYPSTCSFVIFGIKILCSGRSCLKPDVGHAGSRGSGSKTAGPRKSLFRSYDFNLKRNMGNIVVCIADLHSVWNKNQSCTTWTSIWQHILTITPLWFRFDKIKVHTCLLDQFSAHVSLQNAVSIRLLILLWTSFRTSPPSWRS